MTSLRALVFAATGQDVRRCGRCSYCAQAVPPDHDLSLEGLLQLVLMDDEDVLTSRTLLSDEALKTARHKCISTLNVEAILLALREEAKRRGVKEFEG